jgi:hypothetical protein
MGTFCAKLTVIGQAPCEALLLLRSKREAAASSSNDIF